MPMRSFYALAVKARLSLVCQLCGSRSSFDPTRNLDLKNKNLEFADSDLGVVLFFFLTTLCLYLFIY